MDPCKEQLETVLREPISAVIEREPTEFDRLLDGCNRRVVLFGAGNLGQKAARYLRLIGIEPLGFRGSVCLRHMVRRAPVHRNKKAAHRIGGRSRNTGGTIEVGISGTAASELLPGSSPQGPGASRGSTSRSRVVGRQRVLSRVPEPGTVAVLGDHDGLLPPSPEDQYLPHGLFSVRTDEVFVDCGAFDGDTARRFVAKNPAFDHIIALEPDPENFRRLSRWAESMHLNGTLIVHNQAAGAKRQSLTWNATGTESSWPASSRILRVDCAPLDEIVSGYHPTMIKMDIEGAELDALVGASGIIRQNHPILAVCVYHTQSDVWRVPLYIASLWPRYKLFLRAHGDEGRELVCYAVPPDRLMGRTHC